MKNGIAPSRAVAYVIDNKEFRRGPIDDYDDKAIRDFQGFLKQPNRIKQYPSFDTIARRSEWNQPTGYLNR